MKKFFTFCTGLLFVAVLLCSSGMPLAMAFERDDTMSGCPSEQTEERRSDTSCDHSEKLSLGIQITSKVTDELVRTVVLSFPVLPTFLDELPQVHLPSRYSFPEGSYLSHLRSHQTIVLRI